jgi:hypothetical protein
VPLAAADAIEIVRDAARLAPGTRLLALVPLSSGTDGFARRDNPDTLALEK